MKVNNMKLNNMKLNKILAVVIIMSTTVMLTACLGEIPTGRENKQENSAEDNQSALVNPMVEYDSIAALQDASGFVMPDLPAEHALENQAYFLIDQSIAEVQQSTGDELSITIRKAKGNEDISGVYGADLREETFLGTKVQIGTMEDGCVAWWSDGEYAYSVYANPISEDEFQNYLLEIIERAASEET